MKSIRERILIKSLGWSCMGLCLASPVWAQAQPPKGQNEKVDTEVVQVVKPYAPTVADAFKWAEVPVFDIDSQAPALPVTYSFKTFAVASTFRPDKGRAATAQKEADAKRYDHWVRLMGGLYNQWQLDAFLTHSWSNNEWLDVSVRHLGVHQSVQEALVPSTWNQQELKGAYHNQTEARSWLVETAYQRRQYQWYGLRPDYFDLSTMAQPSWQQLTHQWELNGQYSRRASWLRAAELKYKGLADAYQSQEQRLVVAPEWGVDLNQHHLVATTTLDGLFGQSAATSATNDGSSYRFVLLGVKPMYQYEQGPLQLKAGVHIQYLAAKQGDNALHLYPLAEAQYRLISDVVQLYAQYSGGWVQNSYAQWLQINPYLAPGLTLAPTDQAAVIRLGVKGKWTNTLSYGAQAQYSSENDKALLVSQGISQTPNPNWGFGYGNSFGLTYDRVNTWRFTGELRSEWSHNYQCFAQATLSQYQTLNEEKAWNLPALELKGGLEVQWNAKWYSQTTLGITTNRSDRWSSNLATQPMQETLSLPTYIDLSQQVSYKYTPRWTFYLKGNNLLNQQQNRWLYYPVMGIQLLAGGSYAFDW